MFTRKLTLGEPDQHARTVPIVLSTETPVNRGSYVEVLDHSPGSVDLSRAPLPLIESHDDKRLPIGTVEDLRIEGRALRGTARFGNSQRAREVFADVLDRIVTGVSIGYELLDNGTPAGDGRTLRFKFRPLEASAVAVAADINAGFFRSKDRTMNHDHTSQDSGIEPQVLSRSQRRSAAGAIEAERERAADIHAAAAAHNVPAEMTARALAEGWEFQRFGREVLDMLARRGGTLTAGSNAMESLGLSTREAQRYSVARLIRAVSSGRPADAGLEVEASEALKRQLGRQTRGYLVPPEVLRRDLTVAGASTGAKLVGTDHLAGSFIDLLRNSSRVAELGAQRLSGLVGNVAIPKQTGASTAYWLANEGAAITESNPTVDQILMAPKIVGALAEFSFKLLHQSAPGVDALLLNDLAEVVGTAIDAAAIAGDGTGGAPVGILNTAGVGAVAGATLGYAGVLDMQAEVAEANALGAGCAYLATPAVARLLMQRQRFGNTDSPLWAGSLLDGQMAGFRAASSNNVPAGTMIFGDWSQLIIGEWSTLELEINPYANFAAGITAVRALYAVDFAVRQAGAFSVATAIS